MASGPLVIKIAGTLWSRLTRQLRDNQKGTNYLKIRLSYLILVSLIRVAEVVNTQEQCGKGLILRPCVGTVSSLPICAFFFPSSLNKLINAIG